MVAGPEAGLGTSRGSVTAAWRATGTCPRPRPTCCAALACHQDAAQAYRTALDLTDNDAERAFLARRITEFSRPADGG